MPQFPLGISERTPQDDDYILIGKNGQAPGKAKVSAIAAKATEGLAAVAKSGSYNDLTNKPTIPAAVTVDSSLSTTSANPVQNKVITAALNKALTYETTDNLSSLDEVQQCTKPGAYQVYISPSGDPDPLLGDNFGLLVLPVNEGGDYIIQIGYTYGKMAIRGTQAGPGEFGAWTDLTASGGLTVEVIDNLNSTSKTAALSANMGHLLGLQKMAYVNGDSQ